MRTYDRRLVVRANQIGLVTDAEFLDACQEILDAGNAVDLGSRFSAHLGKVMQRGEAATALYGRIHDFKKGAV